MNLSGPSMIFSSTDLAALGNPTFPSHSFVASGLDHWPTTRHIPSFKEVVSILVHGEPITFFAWADVTEGHGGDLIVPHVVWTPSYCGSAGIKGREVSSYSKAIIPVTVEQILRPFVEKGVPTDPETEALLTSALSKSIDESMKSYVRIAMGKVVHFSMRRRFFPCGRRPASSLSWISKRKSMVSFRSQKHGV